MEYFNPKTPDLISTCAVLVVELPADSVATPPPAPVSRQHAEAIAAAIGADLSQHFAKLDELALVMAGALYDQTEVLRPGFPLLKTLEDIFRGTLSQGFVPQIIALGSDSGRFPVTELNPARQLGSGPLLLIPCCLAGRKLQITTLSSNLEANLLENCEVSATTVDQVQHAFAIEAVNMTYATVNDLCALLRVQIENAGFPALADLLEHAIYRRPELRVATLDQGNRFLLDKDTVYTPFYTFDDWSHFGPGQDRSTEQLARDYGVWSRLQRQFVATLEAYGLAVKVIIGHPQFMAEDEHLALSAARRVPTLDSDHLVETVIAQEGNLAEHQLRITNQFHDEVGTMAYTVEGLDEAGHRLSLEHHYPLRSSGLHTIIDQLVRRSDDFGAARQVLHPGALVVGEDGRCLVGYEDAPTAPTPRH